MLSFCLMANPMYSQADFYENYFRDSVSFVFDGMDKIRQADIFTTHKAQFGLGVHDEMIMTNNVVTEDGKLTTKYIMKHKGIPVEGSMMNIIGDKGIVLYANGFLRTGLNVDNTNIISEQDAINAAITYIDADKYIWEDSAARAEYIAEGLDPDSALYPQHAELLITKKRGEEYEHTAANYELCYMVRIYAIEPATVTDVYVNANTGSVFTEQPSGYDAYHTLGSLWTWYDGSFNDLHTSTCNLCTNFTLNDMPRKIKTGKYNNGSKAMKDNNNSWVGNDQKTGASAHWYVGKTWDFYYNKGRAGSNYAYKPIRIYVENPNLTGNAQYIPDSFYDIINIRKDVENNSGATFDILAHEYTHAMIYASSGLGKFGDFEARSMNEGYADIFGMKIEGDVLGWHDWYVGEDLGVEVRRSFADPNSDQSQYFTNNGMNKGGSAAIYMQPGYWSTLNYHANAGIMRKWFHLLSNGGTFNGKTVSPLGIHTAEQIAYITFNWWLWSNVKYPEMASQTVHATIAHYGRCSKEHLQVVNAFIAVGLLPNSIPLCSDVEICCVTVVNVTNPPPFGDPVEEWTANIRDGLSSTGDYTWHIPDGWSAVTEGNKFTLLSHTDNSSKMLSVSYAVDGTTYTDSLAVHFSDEEWEPTVTPPMEPDSKPTLREEDVFNGLTIYPNPADGILQVSIRSFEEQASIEIYNVSGSLIKSLNINNPNADINTSDLANGLYFIKAKTGDRVFVRKFSVIH